MGCRYFRRPQANEQAMTKQKKPTTSKRKRGPAPKRHASSAGAKPATTSKAQICLDLLSRPSGATLQEMQQATGWQPHSVRGLLAGKIKKMSGVTLSAEKPADGPRRYHVKGT
jgi:hypothetical protein